MCSPDVLWGVGGAFVEKWKKAYITDITRDGIEN
jgi:hypothetical protein